jgi:hypothetical protein
MVARAGLGPEEATAGKYDRFKTQVNRETIIA